MNFLKLILLLFVHIALCEDKKKPDFCKLDCDGTANSACGSCAIGSGFLQLGPLYDWRMALLDAHNEYREKVASGGDERGGNGKASNMLVFSYDMDLEFTIGCYLNTKCTFDHDKCRRTPTYKRAGQNLYTLSTNGKDNVTSNDEAKNIVTSWYEEIKDTTAEIIDSFRLLGGGVQIGHYTQMVWAETSAVGCAACQKSSGDMNTFIVGCNYGPAGNWKEKPVYKRGEPATECPQGTKANEKYKSLCGEINIPSEAKTAGFIYKTGSGKHFTKASRCFIALVTILQFALYHILF